LYAADVSVISFDSMNQPSSKDELLAELKDHRLPATLLDAVSSKLRQLEYAEQKVQLLEERLRLQRIEKYGPGSEKLSNLQLELLEEEPGVSQAEVQAESQQEKPAPSSSSKPKRAHPGRQSLPASLPRVERVIACLPEQCCCPHCQQETSVIGYDQSEHLEVEPAKYFVVLTRREKRTCRHCGEGGVVAAPLASRIVDKGLVSDQIVITTLIQKYNDHLPLYRQSAILERETGIEISRATMDGWVMRAGELLLPLAAAVKRELLAGAYLQADETPIPVQLHAGTGSNHQAYLWQYGRPAASTVFDFQMGRGREGPKQFLGRFEGILQTDGYAGYDRVGGPEMIHAACWAHARRKFYEAAKLHPSDVVATGIVAGINELFAVDARASTQKLDHAARHQLRQQEATHLLERLRSEIKAALHGALPASALGKACNYTLTLWHKLTRFLEYPQLELSNNLAENSMRPIALGRKNWIHFGSQQAGPKIAAILSILETCKRLNIPARDYLAQVLPRLANLPANQFDQLTPSAWQSARHCHNAPGLL
jgi:transposase